MATTLKVGPKESYQLSASPTWASREGLGVWKVDNKAIKLYTYNQKLFDKLTAAYAQAAVNGLPVGKTPRIVRAERINGQGGKTDVIALFTEIMTGDFFAVSQQAYGFGKFTTLIDAIADVKAMKLIVGGCTAAVKLGLSDPQGFIDVKNYEPIRFLDIHTSSYSEAAAQMLEIVQARLKAIEKK